MDVRRKVEDEVVIGAGRYFSTLARIMYAPQNELREEVEAARERIKLLGAQNLPPLTDDENLVSLYDTIVAGGPQH